MLLEENTGNHLIVLKKLKFLPETSRNINLIVGLRQVYTNFDLYPSHSTLQMCNIILRPMYLCKQQYFQKLARKNNLISFKKTL